MVSPLPSLLVVSSRASSRPTGFLLLVISISYWMQSLAAPSLPECSSDSKTTQSIMLTCLAMNLRLQTLSNVNVSFVKLGFTFKSISEWDQIITYCLITWLLYWLLFKVIRKSMATYTSKTWHMCLNEKHIRPRAFRPHKKVISPNFLLFKLGTCESRVLAFWDVSLSQTLLAEQLEPVLSGLVSAWFSLLSAFPFLTGTGLWHTNQPINVHVSSY